MAPTDREHDITVDLLMRKYSLLKQEVWLHIGFYKAHVARFQLMGTAILAAAAYVIAHAELLPTQQNWWLWWLATTLIPVMANYLTFDIFESQYAMILLGERMATIEEDINRIVGRRILIWEVFGSPKFWEDFRPVPGVINPDWFLGSLGMIIAIYIEILVPAILYFFLWCLAEGWTQHAIVIAGALLTVTLFSVSTYCGLKILLGMRGKPRAFFRAMLSAPLEKIGQQANGADS
ncbi:MAG TPA: hypothetical protein VGR07_09690 [Thermoanaerobaculia bacterium]|jgi:hypothetical protein|nr:hypothetical protein [Thermoanaerobaculia bacterium]